MAEIKKYSINMVRLRLGDMRGFTLSETFVGCSGEGSFISGRFDCGVRNGEWGRLKLGVETEGYCEYKITAFASNNSVALSDSDWDDKDACRTVENIPELLLHRITGRYFWFRVDVHGTARLYGGALYTFGEVFEDYLPQLYRDTRASFSHRYLSIFYTAYGELSENVRDFGKNLDARTAPNDFLPLLARWMGLDILLGLLSPEELRRVLLYGRYLSRFRGTRRAVLLLSELVTSRKPVLLEHRTIHKNTASPYEKTYGRLYGGNDNVILLLFFEPLEENICARLQRMADMFMPVGNVSRLVVRHSSAVLDGYTYLDCNAVCIHESGGRVSEVKTDEGFRLL